MMTKAEETLISYLNLLIKISTTEFVASASKFSTSFPHLDNQFIVCLY